MGQARGRSQKPASEDRAPPFTQRSNFWVWAPASRSSASSGAACAVCFRHPARDLLCLVHVWRVQLFRADADHLRRAALLLGWLRDRLEPLLPLLGSEAVDHELVERILLREELIPVLIPHSKSPRKGKDPTVASAEAAVEEAVKALDKALAR